MEATTELVEVQDWDDYEEPTCRVCDGLGHGYPGAGPCPLEDQGWADMDEAL